MKLAVHLSYSGSTYSLDLPKVMTIQDLYVAGRKADAAAGVTTLMVGGDVAALRVMAELAL